MTYKNLLADDAVVRDSILQVPIIVNRGSCVDRSLLDPFISIGSFSYLTRSRVGAFTSIGSRCSIGGFNHEMYITCSTFGVREFLLKINSGSTGREVVQDTLIMPDTWIADNVVVRLGCVLGVGSVIGAGSVVTKSTEPYSVYVGNPARKLKLRFTEQIIEKLLASNWWRRDPFKLAPLVDKSPEKFLECLDQLA